MTDRCLDRLRDENSLIWPMMVSAMFRAFSKALSCKDMGSDFMFLRTRVNSVRPRRNRLAIHQFSRAAQRGGSGRQDRTILTMRRRPLVNQEVRLRATFLG